MFSVNLDEAIATRRIGRSDKACEILTIAPALCDRFTIALRSYLCAMSLHARHFGTAPSLAALDSANFQHAKSQRAAKFHNLLSRVMLTRRSQFMHKISALGELVEDLGTSFDENATELEEGLSFNSEACWESLDSCHYDLNTCLRETIVLIKCFLLALPDKQLAEFQASLVEQPIPSKVRVTSSPRHLGHRRLATIKGQ